MKTATIKEILKTREFNRNFDNSIGDLTYQKGEERLKEAADLGFTRTEDGEYLVKGSGKVYTNLLNLRTCSDKTFKETIYDAKTRKPRTLGALARG